MDSILLWAVQSQDQWRFNSDTNTVSNRQPAAVPELLNDQPRQPPKQSHAEHHTGQIEAAGIKDHFWWTGRLQSRKEHQEQIFNLRIFCEEYLQYQQDLYHVFTDFKNVFDRVSHAALWATMTK